MKKTLTKIWGIGLVVVVLASLMVIAVPASPAAAATLAFSTVTTPAGIGVSWQLAAGTDVSSLKVAPNGHLFAINSAASPDVVYKSIDGGRSWVPSVAVADGLTDMAISPSYATDNTLFVISNAAPAQVYISTNGGISFAVLGGTIAGAGTSVAVAPNYAAGIGEVMAGTATDTYVWYRNAVQNWTATTIGSATFDVAFSPNFPLDGTRLAVTSVAGNTSVHTLVGSDAAWNTNAQLLATALVDSFVATNVTMAIPSDFNAQSVATRTVYVGLVSANTTDQVHRVLVGGGVAASALLNNPVGVTDLAVQSIAYNGVTASGILYVGASASANVYRCGNPWAAVAATAFSGNLAPPTGDSMTFVALASDFATSNKVYAGTTGADSALSVSEDGGVYFWQNGLIDNAIVTINDFQAASATEYWMATTDNAGLAESVWKSVDSGASWRRILAVPAATSVSNNGTLTISPNYATDKTVVYAVINATTGALYTTTNSGASWLPYTSPVAVGAFAMKDQYTYYVGSNVASVVQATANGAFFWQAVPTAVPGGDTIANLKYNVANGHLLATANNGVIALSTNGNTTYTALGAVLNATHPSFVAFDVNYATNNIIYAYNTGVAGVYRATAAGPATLWTQIDGGTTLLPRDIICAPDNTLYVSDMTAATATTGGIVRSINPTAPAGWEFEHVATGAAIPFGGDSLVANATLGVMAIAQGSNVMFAVNSAVPAVVAYTDTLALGTATAIPSQTAPASGAVLTSPDEVTFRWNAVSGAVSYTVQFADRQDQIGLQTNANTADTFRFFNGLTGGVKYFWRVRVQTPVIGPWSEVHKFIPEIDIVAPNQVTFPGVPVIPSIGGVVNSLMPTFQWNSVKNAGGYEFQLATDAQFLSPIVDLTGTDALGAVNAYTVTTSLEYGTNYFWRVKAITSTTNSDWSSTQGFLTMAKPTPTATATGSGTTTIVVPTPTVSVTIPSFTIPTPTVTFTAPSATTTEQKIAPAYIWAIIIIGAVLVIAVIVLIVRTRRSV